MVKIRPDGASPVRRGPVEPVPPERVEPSAAAPAPTAAQPPQAAAVDLSARAQELQWAQQLLQAQPAVREELVRELQQRLREGAYRVEARRLAEDMVGKQQ